MLLILCLPLIGCGEKRDNSLADGSYECDVRLEGGTGKATVNSPCTIRVTDGKIFATIVWSSKYYDYMIVNDTKYINESEVGEPSSFTFPIDKLPLELKVIGDTTAMSAPHEIEYTLYFDSVN